MINSVCPVCGKGFQIKRTQGKKQLYDSVKCRNKVKVERYWKRRFGHEEKTS